jgi:polyphosphate kinase
MGQLSSSGRLITRESSWLDFNERVLSFAADPSVPLLERVKFLAIFSGNLDEFYEVRVAGLHEQHAAGIGGTADGTPRQQLEAISDRVSSLSHRQSDILRHLRSELAATGIEIVTWEQLDGPTQRAVTTAFEEGIFPVLTPLAVDPGHPFPYISNKSLNLAVVLSDEAGELRFARVKVPALLPRFVPAGNAQRFLPLEALISAHIEQLFPGFSVSGTYCFRVTRNADLSLADSDAEDLLVAVETELRRRRFGRAVRLEAASDMPEDVLRLLLDELELDPSDVTQVEELLDLTSLWSLHGLPRADLKDEPWTPVTPPAFRTEDDDGATMFEAIRRNDILVHHPYESFGTSVENFIRAAAHDPSVLTIKMTLYRPSGKSPIAQALIEAAELGKQVAVLIELKARFDEQANIAWAKAMEEVGIHVAYGVLGLKTHAKVVLVVRAEEQGLRRYCHLGTGNYNSSTARLYEDLGLFTADPAFGADLTKLFNTLTGFGRSEQFERLIVAPQALRGRVLELIRNELPTETRGPGRILMKLNALVDDEIIQALYEASQAGVEIDLIVRGICCLRPGVPGMSERIRVRSIIGRYLEHSRILHFANGLGDDQPLWLIGSADMMPRNLDRRVETLVPISQPNLVADMQQIAATVLRPDVKGWTLQQDGNWEPIHASGQTFDAQHERYRQVTARAGRER